MNANLIRRNTPASDNAGANRTPVRVFFRRQLGYAAKVPSRMRDDMRSVKQVFVLRNEEGERALSAKVKYPVAQFVATRVGSVIPIFTTLFFTSLSSMSKTAQGLAGGITGDFLGNILALGASWYIFSIGTFRKTGFNNFLSQWSTLNMNALAGLAFKFEKKLDAKERMGETVSSAKRWLFRAAGVALSPFPVFYYAFGAAITAAIKAGMSPVAAVIIGCSGLHAIFIAYATWANKEALSRFDNEFKTDSQGAGVLERVPSAPEK